MTPQARPAQADPAGSAVKVCSEDQGTGLTLLPRGLCAHGPLSPETLGH